MISSTVTTPPPASIKALLKAFLRSCAPRALELITIYRTRRQHEIEHAPMQAEIHARLFGNRPIEVLTGPFKGMRYFDIPTWGCIVPKWLGSYESELHPVVAGISPNGYDTVINVGCAEGYYAVGLARRLPRAKVYAFDIDPWSQRHIQRLAALNDVNLRMTVSGKCDHATLERIVDGWTLIVCDIEGAEEWLLDPVSAPSLANCDILVEMHEEGCEHGLAPTNRNREQLIRQRFPQHKVTVIAATSDATAWCEQNAGLLPPDDLARCADEKRAPGMHWLWLQRGPSFYCGSGGRVHRTR